MYDFSQEGIKDLLPRLWAWFLALSLLALFILTRLFFLQIVRGDFFWILSSEHTVKELRIPAPRGIIFDRHLDRLAENRPSFNLVVIPQYVRDRKALQESLHQLINLDPARLNEAWKKAARYPPYYPIPLVSDLSYDFAARIRVHKVTAMGASDPLDLRGIEVLPRPLRSYPHPQLASATLGHLGEISEEELEQFEGKIPGRYATGDLIGLSGLEKYWEVRLKGFDGAERRVVDAVGREIFSEEVVEWIRNIPPQSGNHLVTTLDLDLQKFSEEQFEGRSGALVVMNLSKGEILALVSRPSFDPGKLIVNVTDDYWQSLLQDPQKLFLHRAVQAYPPGSTFKVVTAIAGLEEGEIQPEDTIYCPGGFRFGGRFFRCWKEGGHGAVNLHRALAESCDTYFYQLGLRLGVDRIARYAHLLGLGEKTGLEIHQEKNGLIPSTDWKKKNLGQDWMTGETLSVAVGQGAVLVTPAQNALLFGQLANGGFRIQPHLTRGIFDQLPHLAETYPSSTEWNPEKIDLSVRTLDLIRKALVDVVASPGGTAHGSRSPRVSFGGKTGTAQVISEEGKQRAGGGAQFEDHAWFVAFAPADSPEIVVSVFVEHGGFGASSAAPIAKKVIEKYSEIRHQEGGAAYD